MKTLLKKLIDKLLALFRKKEKEEYIYPSIPPTPYKPKNYYSYESTFLGSRLFDIINLDEILPVFSLRGCSLIQMERGDAFLIQMANDRLGIFYIHEIQYFHEPTTIYESIVQLIGYADESL